MALMQVARLQVRVEQCIAFCSFVMSRTSKVIVLEVPYELFCFNLKNSLPELTGQQF